MDKASILDKDSQELYKEVKADPKLNRMFSNDASLESLQREVSIRFDYTPEQWNVVEVEFEFDLEERY